MPKLTAYERLQAIRRRANDLALLKEIYSNLFPPEYQPDAKQFELWMLKYDTDLIAECFDIAAAWFRAITEKVEKLKAEGRGVPKEAYRDKTEVIKYASAIMKKKASEPEASSEDVPFDDDETEA
jgi:hypothetical protein